MTSKLNSTTRKPTKQKNKERRKIEQRKRWKSFSFLSTNFWFSFSFIFNSAKKWKKRKSSVSLLVLLLFLFTELIISYQNSISCYDALKNKKTTEIFMVEFLFLSNSEFFYIFCWLFTIFSYQLKRNRT